MRSAMGSLSQPVVDMVTGSASCLFLVVDVFGVSNATAVVYVSCVFAIFYLFVIQVSSLGFTGWNDKTD